MTYASYICAFGPHPDDVEAGCGGVLAASHAQGKQNIIIDLTPSQLSSRGTPAIRQAEAQAAAKILGAERKNLGLTDGAIRNDDETRAIIVNELRTCRPEIVLVPHLRDRHPDHEIVPRLVKDACFFSGLTKYEGSTLPPHKPRLLLQYMIREFFEPDIIVGFDDTAMTAKIEAFMSFTSQHATNDHAMAYLRGRAQTLGFQIKQSYGEGFRTFGEKIGVTSFDDCVTGFR